MDDFRSGDYTIEPKMIAAELNISVRTVRRMCEREELPALKAGRQWRIREDWRTYLEDRAGKN